MMRTHLQKPTLPAPSGPHLRVMRTSKGHRVESRLSDEQAAELIKPLGSDFSRSLVRAVEGGYLTQKQRPWLHKLALEQQSGGPKPTETPDEQLSKLSLFMRDRAAQHPRIKLTLGEIQLSVASKKASRHNQGMIWVKRSGEYMGKITPQGGTNLGEEVIEQLRAFGESPAEAAAKYGQESGMCCFCNRELTDDRSIHVGYGPVCAKKWRLPWGK